jgi:nitrogenase subunit NifH
VRRFAIYGKGGGGKSTVVCNLSLQFARRGLRTLQIGCDPKHDSTRALMGGKRIAAVMDVVEKLESGRRQKFQAADFLFEGLERIGCIEAGGPESGVGCAGLGITTAFRLIHDCRVLDGYDAVLMDVLGDVVCGGFAAPMMKGLSGGVLILASETPMSLYAANNIAKAVRRYARNGTYLAGLLANNVRDPKQIGSIERFAAQLGTQILAVVPHDPVFLRAERGGLPVSALEPGGQFDDLFADLATRLLGSRSQDCPVPTPLSEEAFDGFFWDQSP